MNFYASKPITDALVAEIEDNFQTYLTVMETESGVTLKPIEDVKMGVDYQSKGLTKPFILIEPKRMSIEDEAVGIVSAIYSYDIVFAYDGYQESDATEAVQLYADTFISMVVSDDFFSSNLTHASVKSVEYYPGSSSVTRYAILDVELTLELVR